MRYAPIVKVKQQALDNLENEMAKLNFSIAKTKEQIINIAEQIKNSEKPKSGVIASMLLFQADMDTYRKEIASKTEYLNWQENQKELLTKSIKQAHIELEKMKYLEEQEVLKHKEKLKKQEAANLDEIGLILFNNRNAS